MDIDEVKKFIQNKIETDNLTQKVRDVIKTKKWEKQDLKEGFKETFKPLLKSQTNISETIKKENVENIKNLKKNQLALMQGLQAIGELMPPPPEEDVFKDASSLTPEPSTSTAEPLLEIPLKKPKGPVIDLEVNMDEDDINYLEESGFIRPINFLKSDPEILKEKLKRSNKLIQSLNGEVNGYSKKKFRTMEDIVNLLDKKNKKKTMQNYKAVLSTYIDSIKYQKGKGIYFQNPHQLLNRLELLVGSILAGNNGVIPEFSQLAHFLNQSGIITKKQLNDLLKSYIRIK